MALDRNAAMAAVIGKPAETIPQLRWQKSSDINWNDFNYPPLLNLIHYDAAELPESMRFLVRCLNLGYVFAVLACWDNTLNSFIFVPTTNAPLVWLMQSLLHLLLLPSAALSTFYLGYRGLAEPDPQLLNRYRACQLCLMATYVVFSLAPVGCINGIWRLQSLGGYSSSTRTRALWTALTIVEACLWTISAGLGLAGVLLVRRRSVEEPSSMA